MCTEVRTDPSKLTLGLSQVHRPFQESRPVCSEVMTWLIQVEAESGVNAVSGI